jgi:phosphatidate cytidylyltransferase
MKRRIIPALILLAVFIPLLFIGGLPFEIGVTILSCLGLKELIDIYEKENKVPKLIKFFSYLSISLLVLSQDSLLAGISLSILFLFIPLIIFKSEEYNFKDSIFLLGIILFVGIPFYLMNNIRAVSIDETIYILLISILTDTFAYIGGKLFGKHKLLPRISPNKTIEGSLIGLIVGVIISSLYYLLMIDPGMSIFLIICISIIISIFGQIGDLIFSSIKRYYKIKDFSNILRGHGGILDRFDSLITITLVYVVIKILFL